MASDLPPDDPDDDDDLVRLVAEDEEPVFGRDPLGRLVRVDATTQADLQKTVRIRVDGSDWFEVPKAVPLTDAQGNVVQGPDGRTRTRPTTIYDAARAVTPPGDPPADGSAADASGFGTQSLADFSLADGARSLADVILEAAVATRTGQRTARIPVLCHQDHLTPVAVCRVCTVQVVSADPRDPAKRKEQRKLLPACQHRVEDGMEVHTMWSPDGKYRAVVRAAVQVLYELLAGDHRDARRDAALGRAGKYHNELDDLRAALAASWAAYPADVRQPDPVHTARAVADRQRVSSGGRPRFPGREAREDLVVGRVPDLAAADPAAVAAPPFVVDHNSCILCDRCGRACGEVKPFQVIGRSGKGPDTRIAFDLRHLPMAQSSCRACGECMTACPTGAISFQYRVADVSPRRRAERADPAVTVVEADDLLAHPLFGRLPKAFLEWNRGAVRVRRLTPGEVLAAEGEYGTTAYLLEDGHLAVCRAGGSPPPALPHADRPAVADGLRRLPRRLGPAIWVQHPDPVDLIGEMAPMSHARRNASLVAVTPATVLEIDRNVLFLLARDPANRDRVDRKYAGRALREFLPKLAAGPGLFGALTRAEVDGLIEAVAPAAQLVRAAPGYVVCREGEPADDFYLIRLGFVNVTRAAARGAVRPPLRQGDCFGEVALLTRRVAAGDGRFPPGFAPGVRAATCTALDHAELVRVPGDAFDAFLTRPAAAGVRAKLLDRAADLLRGTA